MFSLRLGMGLGSGMATGTPSILSIVGLTGGVAIEGDHASLTMSASEGTISARAWGSTSGGSEFGTGTSPTDYTGSTTLYATATIDGEDYTVSAPIAAAGSGWILETGVWDDTGAWDDTQSWKDAA